MRHFLADFDEDGDADPTNYDIWVNAFDLNQLGNADNDGDADGADFLRWQQQFGSAPAVAAADAVPEPVAGAFIFWVVSFRAARGRSSVAASPEVENLLHPYTASAAGAAGQGGRVASPIRC
jgi:hypothetical protein